MAVIEFAMELNVLKWLFVLMTIFIVIVGNLINFVEDYLPVIVVQTFRYGKFSYNGQSSWKLVEVPKSWFRHFYVFSTLFGFYALYLAVDVYLYGAKPSQDILNYLDIVTGSNRRTTIEPFSVLLALTLMSFQCVRRFYETWFVSVFSRGRINLSHYLVGFIHYWGTISVILAEAKGFGPLGSATVKFSQLSFYHVLGTILFLYAWYHQFQAAVILANLRKDKNGNIVTSEHKIAFGGLFERLSSPHLTCEVLMYLGLTIILKQSSTFLYVFLWVLSNQAETAFLNHWWYKKAFKNYPKQRKAFIPYLL